MQVSVRQLKDHLSEYLHRVTQGELIIVTSHQVPMVRLLPIPQTSNMKIRDLLQTEGIQWNGKKPTGGKRRPHLNGDSASERVLDDRA